MKKIFIMLALAGANVHAQAQQSVNGIRFAKDSMTVQGIVSDNRNLSFKKELPVVSYIVDNEQFDSRDNSAKIGIQWSALAPGYGGGLHGVLVFQNRSKDTIQLENVVPFGLDRDHIVITGKGKHGLSRTHLFQAGKEPVNVIVPDNAWDLGYGSFNVNNDMSVASLVRRDRASIDKGTRSRFETKLFPGGTVKYNFYVEAVKGNDWRDALTKVFQDRMLYDVEKFDNSLFQRDDLKWIRHTYVMHLMMTWDKFYYDLKTGKHNLMDFVARGKKLYGGDDVISIWPTWPTLGLDQRNQFDLFRDLPGGTKQLRKLSGQLHDSGIKFFVCYNPWDESTRSENHFSGISDLIAETAADGVVLDTKGESSKELQDAADKVRKGVIMYSEGMAVPKDMEGIPSGRVHNALYYAPMLNLNKLIKPEFAIYRVAELFKEKIQREFATSFFNGYGTEINIMAPGQPDWVEEQYDYFGRTSRILRQNTYNFTGDIVPLISTSTDKIWVNKWPSETKTIYTIYSVRPEGYKGMLFNVEPEEGYHFVDLWHHKMLEPKQENGKWWIEAETNAFNSAYLGTNNEGEVDCIAKLPSLIYAHRNGDQLTINTPAKGTEILVWAGKPSYTVEPKRLRPGKNEVEVSSMFGRFEGNIIIQLMDDGILLDEVIEYIKPGESRRISEVVKTKLVAAAPDGMVKIPAGSFTFKATNGDEFIPYPTQDKDSSFQMKSFFMDRYPVTNAQYKKFLDATKYKPSDTANYLKHWVKGKIKKGEENFPVVYISYEDAKAYSKWAGKRLPTEIEWQYAAQTSDLNEWPWKQETPVTRKIQYVTNTLSTSALEGIDSSRCNLGDGKLYPVGKYKEGVNPNGLYDLVGSVWQLTNDEYMSGSYRYIIMKGGSYFKPSSSWWYVQGGPRELHYRQHLLRMSQGFERNATVGFRCIKDAQ